MHLLNVHSLLLHMQGLVNFVFPYRRAFMAQPNQVNRERRGNQHSTGGVTDAADRHRHTKEEILFMLEESERFASQLGRRVAQEDQASLELMRRRYDTQYAARKFRAWNARCAKVLAGKDKRIAASSEALIAGGIVQSVKVHCPPAVLGRKDYSKMVRADVVKELNEMGVECDPKGVLKSLRTLVAKEAKKREDAVRREVETRVSGAMALNEREMVALVGEAMVEDMESGACEEGACEEDGEVMSMVAQAVQASEAGPGEAGPGEAGAGEAGAGEAGEGSSDVMEE